MVEFKENNFADYRTSIAVYGLMLLIVIYIGRIQELIPGLNNFSIGKIVFVLSILLVIVSPRDRNNSLSGIIQIKYIVGIFICSVLSIPFSYWPGGSLNFVTQTFFKTLIFFFLIATVVKNITEVHKVVWAITCSVFALSLTVLISGGDGRLSASSTYDPNDLAFVLVTFMPIIYYFMKQKFGIEKIVLVTVLIMMLIATLATESRGGITGLVVISAIIFKKQGNYLKQSILPLIVIIVVVNLYASNTFWDRMSTMLNPKEDYNMSAGGGRVEIWKSGLKMMIRRPLNGVGINAFEFAEGATHTDLTTGISGKWNAAHNSFIQIGAELGLIGLFLFIKLLSSSIIAIRDCRANPGGGMQLWLLDGIEVAIYGYITTGFFLSQAYSSIFYMLIALAVIIQKLEKQAISTSPIKT
ncbi:MAG TPA: hypothetical protein DEP50_07965 [Acinetobacter lwoffii]|nr:hypothetical protein [Acinetobacter lwoffii]